MLSRIATSKEPRFRGSRFVFFLFCIMACLDLASVSQISLSTLRGTVTDASGAVIPSATVTLNDAITGAVIRHQPTNAQGDYEIADVKPGTYQVRCDQHGYKTFTANDVILTSGEVRRIDIQMALGAVTQTVEVTAGASVIDTETGSIGGVIGLKEIANTPEIDVYPTVANLLPTIAGIQGGTGTFPNLRYNGATGDQASEAFDGIINDTAGNQSNNPAFFKEISAVTVNGPAENSRLAYHNLTTKSGTNQWHGTALYKVLSSGLMANPYFTPKKVGYLEHTWELDLGGPILKDRTFFYASWYAEKIPLGSFVNATVPTNPMRAGNFAGYEVVQPPPPATQLPATSLNDPLNGYTPFANFQLTHFSSVSQQLQTLFYPAATTLPDDGMSSTNNLGFKYPYPGDVFKGDWLMGRIDQKVTSNNSLFVRWLMRRNPYILQKGLPTTLWTRWRLEEQAAVGDTHIFSSSLVNTFTFGVSREYIHDGSTINGVTPQDGAQILATSGLMGSNPGDFHGQGSPAITVSGLTAMTVPDGGVQSNNYTHTYLDTLSWSKGRHNWKFGENTQLFRQFVGAIPDYGSFTFDGSMSARNAAGKSTKVVTGNVYADFLMGIPKSASRSNPIPNRTENASEFGLFAEDNWQVTPRLTVNYGLRWDYFGSPSYADQMMYTFDPTTKSVVVPQATISKVSPIYPSNIPVVPGKVVADSKMTNFRPRFSAAFRLTPTLVLRGGYGQFTERIQPFTMVGGGGPFSIAETYQNVAGQNTASGGNIPLLTFPNPFPASLATAQVANQSVVIFPQKVNNGVFHQFNVTVEKQLGKNGLRASYVGLRGRGMNYSLNINQPPASTTPFVASSRPYPNLIGVTQYRSDGAQNYNSYQIEAKRLSGGATFDVHYSYQTNMLNDQDIENPDDVTSHWSNDQGTRHHYLVGTATYRLPVGRGERFLGHSTKFVDETLGGWSFNFITYFGSGLFYTPAFTGTNPSNTGRSGGLPDLVGNVVPAHRSYKQWWDVSAFTTPANGHFGNAKPFSLKGEDLNVQHLSILKKFPLTERASFTFVAAISNLLNHPYFNNAQLNISTNNFGAFTSVPNTQGSNESAAQRLITLSGRIDF